MHGDPLRTGLLATARGWQLAERFRYGRLKSGPDNTITLEPNTLLLPGGTRAGFVRRHRPLFCCWIRRVWIFLGKLMSCC